MPGIKGRTNNPNGRPPKSRALTAVLERAMSQRMIDPLTGKHTAKSIILARHVSTALLDGEVHFPDGHKLVLAAREWGEFARWFYQHVDGPARVAIDLTSGGLALKGYTTVSPDDWDDQVETQPDSTLPTTSVANRSLAE